MTPAPVHLWPLQEPRPMVGPRRPVFACCGRDPRDVTGPYLLTLHDTAVTCTP